MSYMHLLGLLKENKLNETFCVPCIVVNSYNKSQRDALFHKFILVKDSTCFGQTYWPSSGVSTPWPLAVNITSMTNTNCCVYSVGTPDGG